MKSTHRATLTIMRHGETEYNRLKLITGRFDSPLTETGIEQARAAGDALADFWFDKIYSSDLSRAFNTAALAVGRLKRNNHLKNPDGNWDIEKRPELAEVDYGDFTGRDKRTDPEIIAFPRRPDLAPPNGESFNDAFLRVKTFYKAEILPRLERGENVLIVCHAGIVRIFDYVLKVGDIPGGEAHSDKKSIGNASSTVFSFEDGRFVSMKRVPSPVLPKPSGM